MRFVGGFSLGLLVYRIEGVGVRPSICTFFNFYATLDSTCAFSISGPWIFFLSYVRKYSCFRSTGYSILLMYVRITYLHTYSYVRCFILHFYIGFHVCIFDFWALDILLLYLHRYSCLCSAGYSILLMYICMYYVPTYLQYVHCFILHFYIGFHMCIFDLWALDILLTYLHMYSCSRSPGYLILLMYTCNFCNVIACFTLNRYFKVYKH